MFNPHWRIWVDWNGNELWGEAGEDVAPETTGLHWEWGRGPDSERCPPARLELDLRNDGHKFSPPNAASPLYGSLKPGRRVWAQLAWPFDDFSGSDGADLDGRTLPVGPGFAWKKQNPGAKGFQLAGGGRAVAVTGSGADAVYTVDLGDGDASLGLHFTRQSDGHGGLALRTHNPYNYLRIRFGATATVLERVLYGIAINVRSGDPLASGVEHFLEVEMHGPSIHLFATDLDGGSVIRQEILDGGGTASNATATRHGLWHNGTPDDGGSDNGGSDADRWSHFGGWRSFFNGSLDSIEPRPEGRRRSCRLVALDDLQRLEDTLLYTLITGTGLTSGGIANAVLTRAGFSANRRELDGGRQLMASGPRPLWRLLARRALHALQEEEDGFIYVDGAGRLRLEASGHRSKGSHGASRATFRSVSGPGPYLSDLVWNDGAGGIENPVTFRFHALEDRGAQEVWRLREVPTIPPGESRDFLAETSAFAAVAAVRVPAAATDYTGNSKPDGSGTDLIALLTVTLPSTDEFQGRGTVVRVANGSASVPAWVTLLKLTAGAAYRETEATIYEAGDAAGIGERGERSREVDCIFIDNYAAARDAADARLSRRKTPSPWLSLTLPNGSAANLSQVAHRVLSDRITVVCAEMGINRDFFIEQMTLDAVAATGEITARWQVSGV